MHFLNDQVLLDFAYLLLVSLEIARTNADYEFCSYVEQKCLYDQKFCYIVHNCIASMLYGVYPHVCFHHVSIHLACHIHAPIILPTYLCKCSFL